jgi:hypothetical protein
VWNSETGEPIAILNGHTSRVRFAAFSPDGTQTVTASSGHTARIWEVSLWEELTACVGPIDALGWHDVETGKHTIVQLFEQRLDLVRANPTGVCEPSRDLLLPASPCRIAANGRSLRFFDTSTESDPAKQREHAVFRMDADIESLQMTGDGTRLIIHLADSSARVWDIRDPEERRKDLQAEWAERVPAGAYLDGLWEGDTPTDGLLDAIISDQSLTPLRRLVAAEMLDERRQDARWEAEHAFKALTEGQTDKAAVLAAAESAELHPRVKEIVLESAKGWEYRPPEASAEEKLAEEEKKRRLAEAEALIEGNGETPGVAPGKP